MATFTRSSATSLQGTLRLQNVSPTVSWFSGEPQQPACNAASADGSQAGLAAAPYMLCSTSPTEPSNVPLTDCWLRPAETPRKAAGHLSAQKVAGPEFYLRAGMLTASLVLA